MSDKLTREATLIGLILAEPDNGYYGPSNCAMRRAANAIGLEHEWNLLEVGERLGFSWAESAGIQQGWDLAAGNKTYYESCYSDFDPEFRGGKALGKRLYELVRTSEVPA